MKFLNFNYIIYEDKYNVEVGTCYLFILFFSYFITNDFLKVFLT